MNVITYTSLRDELGLIKEADLASEIAASKAARNVTMKMVNIRKPFLKTKVSFDAHRFKEGLQDEGIPLTGATIGAGIGHALHGRFGLNELTGSALGYAAGGGASLLRSKLKGEEPSEGRRMLAGGALGYGVGGLTHAALSSKVFKPELAQAGAKGLRALGARAFHGVAGGKNRFITGAISEGLPALGATLGTGLALATYRKHPQGAPAPTPPSHTVGAPNTPGMTKLSANLTVGALSLFKTAGTDALGNLTGRAGRMTGLARQAATVATHQPVKTDGFALLKAIKAGKGGTISAQSVARR